MSVLYITKLSGSLPYDCTDCRTEPDGDSVEIKSSHPKADVIEVATALAVTESQKIRVSLSFKDYIANLLGDTSMATLQFNVTLEYSDSSSFVAYTFSCASKCTDGTFIGQIDLLNSKTDTVKV